MLVALGLGATAFAADSAASKALLHTRARAPHPVQQVSPLEQLASTASPVASTADRLQLRADLLELLPPENTGPQRLEGRALELVEALELLENVPASSGFLQLGLQGRWALKGTIAAPAPQEEDASDRSEQAQPLVELLDVGARFEALGALGATVSTVKFRVLEDDLVGSYEIDLTAGIDPDRSDTLYYVTNGRKLQIKRAPESCDVPTMMEALHANLPAEFLGEEGVRLGMQTTYLDECLRITRCITRSLAGSCAVHVRLTDAD